MNSQTVEKKNSSFIEIIDELLFKEKYDTAIERINEVIDTDPNNVDYHHLSGLAHARKGDFITAERIFKNELKLNNKRADAYFNLGIIHSQQNRLTEARSDFENVVELNPDDASALNDLGVISYNLGDLDKGFECFENALKVDPSFKDAFLNLFELAWNTGKYSLALEYAYDYLKKLTPDKDAQPGIAEPNESNKPKSNHSLTIHKTSPTNAELPEVSISAQPLITKSVKLELFSEHVPEEYRKSKTGMNLVLVTDETNYDQMTKIFEHINKASNHRARLIHIGKRHDCCDLCFEMDNEAELIDLLINNADFYHITGTALKNKDLRLNEHLRPDNSLVGYYGGQSQTELDEMIAWHQEHQISGLMAPENAWGAQAPLVYSVKPLVAHTENHRLPKPVDTIKIACWCDSDSKTDLELYEKTIANLSEIYNIESIMIDSSVGKDISGFDEIHLVFAGTQPRSLDWKTAELLSSGKVIFTRLSRIGKMLYPDLPVVDIKTETFEAELKNILKNKIIIAETGLAASAWSKIHLASSDTLKQYISLYELIAKGNN